MIYITTQLNYLSYSRPISVQVYQKGTHFMMQSNSSTTHASTMNYRWSKTNKGQWFNVWFPWQLISRSVRQSSYSMLPLPT